MNKKDLVRELSFLSGHSMSIVTDIIDALPVCLTEALNNGDTVSIPGVGRFRTFFRSSRSSKNPVTGELLEIEAHRAVTFRSSVALKKSLL